MIVVLYLDRCNVTKGRGRTVVDRAVHQQPVQILLVECSLKQPPTVPSTRTRTRTARIYHLIFTCQVTIKSNNIIR